MLRRDAKVKREESNVIQSKKWSHVSHGRTVSLQYCTIHDLVGMQLVRGFRKSKIGSLCRMVSVVLSKRVEVEVRVALTETTRVNSRC